MSCFILINWFIQISHIGKYIVVSRIENNEYALNEMRTCVCWRENTRPTTGYHIRQKMLDRKKQP